MAVDLDISALTTDLNSSGKYPIWLKQFRQHFESSGAQGNNICLHPLPLHVATAALELVVEEGFIDLHPDHFWSGASSKKC